MVNSSPTISNDAQVRAQIPRVKDTAQRNHLAEVLDKAMQANDQAAVDALAREVQTTLDNQD